MSGGFEARVFLVGGPPDHDRDVIFDAAAGQRVKVSLDAHDTLNNPTLAPAGEATLERRGNAVVAVGTTFDTPRGRALRAKLTASGAAQQWSIGYEVLRSRAPAPSELKIWPDARRVIESWRVLEVSPVSRGSCGPSCRTLDAKGATCRGGCERAKMEQRAAADLVIAEAIALDEAIKAGRPSDVREASSIYVPGHVVELAERACETACKDLRLPPLRVRWFKEPRQRRGFFSRLFPGAIWLRADLAGPSLVRTAAHEVAHAAGYGEREAQAYGERLMKSDWRWWPNIGAPIYG